MVKVKIDLTDLKSAIKEIHEKETHTKTYAEIISKELSKIAKDVIEYISKNEMIENNDMPYAPLVRLKKGIRKTPIKFKLPKRLSKIRKRTHNLKLALKVKRGKHTSIKHFKGSKQLRIGLYVVGDEKKAPYLAIQNYGGKIKAKNKYLTIPIHKESFGKSPRRFTGTIKRGKIIYKKEKRGLYRPLYLLKKEIELKPFYFIEKGVKGYVHSSQFKEEVKNLEERLIKWAEVRHKRGK